MTQAMPMEPQDGTMLLSRSDIAAVLSLADCIKAVERSFRLHAQGASLPPRALGVEAPKGGFHVKAAGIRQDRIYFAAKTNANFPGNPQARGLPAIQGVVLLFDADDGRPLAVMDSGEITRLRTAATTALAARYLARDDAQVATIIGCGVQGRAHLEALMHVRKLQRVYAVDRVASAAAQFAQDASASLGLDVRPATDVGEATRRSDIVVTCTPSPAPILWRADVPAGAFIAGVGADNPHKHELDPDLLAAGTVVADDIDQCAAIGDLHHAIAAGVMKLPQVHAELADIVSGRKPARRSSDEITIFDSTGIAIEDVAAAVAVFERASQIGGGRTIRFAA